MLSKKEVETYWEREPRWDDTMYSLESVLQLPGPLRDEIKEAVAIARKFNDAVGRPRAMELDLKVHDDPDYLPWDLVEKANEWGFYSMWIPKVMGGKGYSLHTMSYFMEELSSVCPGIANVVGVHYLGVATLAASMNLRLMSKLFKDVIKGEKEGKPCIFSTAITEPSAGTDVEEVELVEKGTVRCQAKRVEGGYVINGTKIFISMGHMSTWHMIICYEDLKNPADSMVEVAVKTGTKGFSFGRIERKMGQKGCCASELVFEDCFIPDEYVCLDSVKLQQSGSPGTVRDAYETLLDDVLSASRQVVGSFGLGAARGAYETALGFASKTEVEGKLLINHEWAQCMLAEMLGNVSKGRLVYAEAGYALALNGQAGRLLKKPAYMSMKLTPEFYFKSFVTPFVEMPWFTQRAIAGRLKDVDRDAARRSAGWGSFAKFYCTDMGIKNCHLAVELMGQAGVRHDRRAEKLLRDAKLLQIYEGTNQLNRLNLFKSVVAPQCQGVALFEE